MFSIGKERKQKAKQNKNKNKTCSQATHRHMKAIRRYAAFQYMLW